VPVSETGRLPCYTVIHDEQMDDDSLDRLGGARDVDVSPQDTFAMSPSRISRHSFILRDATGGAAGL